MNVFKDMSFFHFNKPISREHTCKHQRTRVGVDSEAITFGSGFPLPAKTK